jgi:hypothetical protein
MPPISQKDLDYLQYIGLPLETLSTKTPVIGAPKHLRGQWHLLEVARNEKQPEKQPTVQRDQKVRLPSEDLLTGLFGYNIPLAFVVRGTPSSVAIHIGTWLPTDSSDSSSQAVNQSQEVLRSLLNSMYPATTMHEGVYELRELPLAGLVLGTPTAKQPDSSDGALALDRLIRAMSGTNWACMLLAQPVEEGKTSELRNRLIESSRAALASQATGTPKPLVDQYTEMSNILFQSLSDGLSIGMWRTSVFLLGDRESYPRLASLWRGIYSGDESRPQALRVWEASYVATLAADWSTPNVPGPSGPSGSSGYQHPYTYQTLLNSKQLAAYVHLPALETSGFAITTIPDFDVVPPKVGTQPSVDLGKIMARAKPIEQFYAIRRDDLTRHVFIAGVTGAGKTNTTFHILKQCGVPFLVIEPAKAEYRELLNDPSLAQGLQIFTLGNERISPFRLNPFEVLEGIPVGVHLDMLRSVFSVSFGMWTPLPQVLEQCLHAIYTDRGWDITTNLNHRLPAEADRSLAFPTLADLAAKVQAVTAQLGYDKEITSNVRAALLTRINSLRTGGKGRMLDVRRSLPMDVLLKQPTILELEGLGDDDDKAFVMGLLLIRLVEYRRAAGQSQGLQHLLIIEEAHRLLANVGMQTNEGEGNPRGKAVEAFSNMLAEVRAYGQGIIIGDQVPVKLAPDVIKNTNLKIAHRIVAADDRQVIAGAMAMDERQTRALATLKRGQAAVFSEGDDVPVLIEVPLAKNSTKAPNDQQVAEVMRSRGVFQSSSAMLLPLPGCAQTCANNASACETASRMVEDPKFQRVFAHLVQSTIEDIDALDRLWPDFVSVVRAKRPAHMNSSDDLLTSLATHASDWLVQRRGIQAEWPYLATERFSQQLRQVLLDKIRNAQPSATRKTFRDHAIHLHERNDAPFPMCERICKQQPSVCLYRYAVANLIADGNLKQDWVAAEALDKNSPNHGSVHIWEFCVAGALTLIEEAKSNWPIEQQEAGDAAARRVAFCLGQQMLELDETKSLNKRRQSFMKLEEPHYE